MSRLRLYKEITLDTMVSLEGSFANADATDSIDGLTGGTDTAQLWAATEQTTLAADLDDSALILSLTAVRFAGSSYLVLRCEDELMLITSNGGTTAPRVTRGYGDSTAAAHVAGTRVYAAYEYQMATVTAVETGGADTNYTVDYSLDSVSFSASLALGYIGYNDSVKLYRRVTVEADTPTAIKTDIIHRLAAGIDQVEVVA